ncbi:MAG: COX15/CtaA family protein [Spongiibacteraceae bacterium]|jgi:cytochrome c oxidase assembly protein subunit 15|nr:COX15/CtaA family protein [Spongiibacteraceae bacterium]
METPAHPLSRKPGYRLALAGCVLAVLVVGLGAFTRLVDAGLGCPDWPGCYGHILWPEHAHEIAAANAAFPHAPVETHKTWPEQVHRLFASSLGLVVLGLFFVALRHRDRRLPVASMLALLAVLIVATVGRVVKGDVLDPYLLVIVATYFLNLLRLWWLQPAPSAQPLRLPALLAGAVILQGLFGMWTVTLKLWPQVVTGHLLGGFTILSLLWLLSLRLGNRPWRVDAGLLVRLRALRPWVFGGLVIVVVQIALGGWMTSNYADVACPDLPRCQARWWPPMDFAQGFNVFQEVGPTTWAASWTMPHGSRSIWLTASAHW